MTRFEAAIERIDAANAADPNTESFGGETHPKELLYGRRMTAWLDKVDPDASEALKLAARAQHIERWKIPRQDYPEGKKGYHLWRTTLYRFHADRAAEILKTCGYDAETIERTRQLLLKKNLRSNEEMQTLEDVICLVFLENYFADFSQKHDEEKIIGIVRKTWGKMTERGHELALGLELSDEARAIVGKALSA